MVGRMLLHEVDEEPLVPQHSQRVVVSSEAPTDVHLQGEPAQSLKI